MSEGHAFCAPSGWDKWSNCAGSAALEEQEPDSESEYAAEGSLMHELAARLLVGQPADVPPSLADPINVYVKGVRDRVAAYKLAGALEVQLFVENKIDISSVTGEKNAKGTVDCIMIAAFPTRTVLEVRDAKFGAGVEVFVKDNGQLVIYALGVVAKYALLNTFDEIVLAIHQPRIRESASEWQMPFAELDGYAQDVWDKAELALSLRNSSEALDHLTPGDHCRFCKVKARCPALAKMIDETVLTEFDDESFQRLVLDDNAALSVAMSRVPLIEQRSKAIRAKVEQLLFAGEPVDGFKLVMGRRGARQWSDEDAVMKLLLADGQAPDKILTPGQLLSPTQLEKPLKDAPIWETLAADFITQAEGKPSVAPLDDEREPYRPNVAADFDSYDGSDLV